MRFISDSTEANPFVHWNNISEVVRPHETINGKQKNLLAVFFILYDQSGSVDHFKTCVWNECFWNANTLSRLVVFENGSNDAG